MTRNQTFESHALKLLRTDTDLLLANRTIEEPSSDNKSLISRPLTVEDLTLKVNIPAGRVIDKDINCNSKFMLDVMDEIGQSVRTAHSFLPSTHPIYLFMDNAGGHGKKEVKKYM